MICCREAFWVIAHTSTIVPNYLVRLVDEAEPVVAAAVGQRMNYSNPIRRGLFTYFHFAGIDHGYGYFAPNIPGSYKLVFELRYAGGRTEYELPCLKSYQGDLTLSTLLDTVGRSESERLRAYLIRGLVRSIWQKHPDANSIRAILGVSTLPTMEQFRNGQRASYQFLHAYDFNRSQISAAAN